MSSKLSIPVEFKPGLEEASRTLASFDYVLLAAHLNPDGDALGSLAACAEIMSRLGKKSVIYCPGGIPHYLEFVPLAAPVAQSLSQLPFAPQSAIYLDCSEPGRLGSELAGMYLNWPSLNIDHHVTDKGLGTVANYIHAEASATTQLVAYVATSLNIPLSGALALAISLGLITDTGGFCHCNTTPDIFYLSAILASNGCDFSWLREKLQNNWTIGKTHLWGHLLKSLRLEDQGRIAFCEVTQETLKHYHCTSEDLEGLIDQFRRIHTVQASLLLREEKPALCKFSLRSHGSINVRDMAAELGGGGHVNAAGGTLNLPLPKAAHVLLEVVKKHLAKENYSDGIC